MIVCMALYTPQLDGQYQVMHGVTCRHHACAVDSWQEACMTLQQTGQPQKATKFDK